MLQMMYLRMTDSKSAAREGEGVYSFACCLHPCLWGSPYFLVANKNGSPECALLIAIKDTAAAPDPSAFLSQGSLGYVMGVTRLISRWSSQVTLEECRALSHTACRWQGFISRLV